MAFWICLLVFIARSAIFYPAIISWSITYILSEIILKYTLFNYKAEININASITSCKNENYQPTSVLLVLENIKSTIFNSKMNLNAGQYICISIPAVDERLGCKKYLSELCFLNCKFFIRKMHCIKYSSTKKCW